MKDHTEYKYKLYSILHKFLQKRNVKRLTEDLQNLESLIRDAYSYSDDQSIWFRLFDDDNLVTDIDSILHDLNGYNRKYILKALNDSVREASIRIHFS